MLLNLNLDTVSNNKYPLCLDLIQTDNYIKYAGIGQGVDRADFDQFQELIKG
jgi:hypothetical protein